MSGRKVNTSDKFVSPGITWVRYRAGDLERLFRSPIVKVDIETGKVLEKKAWS